MIERKELKTEAREAMRETRPHPFWVTLAVTAILLLLQGLSLNLSGELDALRAMFVKTLEGQFAYVLLALNLLLYILNKFLTLRSTTLVEARIDVELIWIHQLRHCHAQ